MISGFFSTHTHKLHLQFHKATSAISAALFNNLFQSEFVYPSYEAINTVVSWTINVDWIFRTETFRLGWWVSERHKSRSCLVLYHGVPSLRWSQHFQTKAQSAIVRSCAAAGYQHTSGICWAGSRFILEWLSSLDCLVSGLDDRSYSVSAPRPLCLRCRGILASRLWWDCGQGAPLVSAEWKHWIDDGSVFPTWRKWRRCEGGVPRSWPMGEELQSSGRFYWPAG